MHAHAEAAFQSVSADMPMQEHDVSTGHDIHSDLPGLGKMQDVGRKSMLQKALLLKANSALGYAGTN